MHRLSQKEGVSHDKELHLINKLEQNIFCEHTISEYDKAIDLAKNAVTKFLKTTTKPFSGIRPKDIKQKVDDVDLNIPLKDYKKLINEVEEIYVQHATAYHLPRYIAHLNCPVVIPALAAEVLISAINSSQDTYDQSAGGTFMERKLINWTGEQIGFDSNCDGIFTAGGSQSNLMGLLLARDYFSLEHLQWNIKLQGSPVQANRFRIFVSDKAHFSNHKNASIMGLGEQAVISVETDNRFRMIPEKLEEAISRELNNGNIPIAIVATAGTTDFGNIDPLAAIADIASLYGLWLHVDAAYGCGLLLTETHRHKLCGIERADSVTIDYHKSFFQPISSSAFLVKNKLHLNIIKHHADYLNPKEQDYDALPAQINKSIVQSTRRFDALKLWFTLRHLGKEKLGEYTDLTIQTALQTANLLDADPEFELLSRSDMGVLVFRIIHPEPFFDLDKLNQYIKEELFYSGDVLLASTRVNGNFYLKFTIFNPLTSINDIQQILNLIKFHANAYVQQPIPQASAAN